MTTCESAMMPTARFQIRGTRQVLLIKFMSVVKHLKASGKPNKELRFKDVMKWLDGAKVDDLEKLKGDIFWCAQGPQDILVIPAAWLFKEKVGSRDVCGVKASFIQACDVDTLTEACDHLEAAGSPNKKLATILDQLLMQES